MAHIETFIQSAWQHLRADRPKQAMDCAKKAHAISPNSPDVAHLLGLLASRDGNPEIALPLLQKAIDTGGKTAHRLRHMAEALLVAGYPEAALTPLNEAIAMFGESVDLLGLKSAIEIGLEQWDDAMLTAQKAIDLNPHLMAWDLNLSIAQLMTLRLEDGFKNATARVENITFGGLCPALMYSKSGTLWLKGEQGIGDTLFFMRYVPALVKKGWQFHLEVDKKLVPLLQNSQLFLSVKEKNKCPKGEICFNIGDLPLIALQCGISEIPQPLPLVPDKKLVEKYRAELAKIGPAPYVAVTWRAGPKGRKQRAGIRALEKVINPTLLGGLLAKTKATIINLQRLPLPDEVLAFQQALGRKSADYSAFNNNLSGMLALLSLVDDYYTVSNSNLHLREGLAKPSHVFVNRPLQDWRWQAEGEGSVWYPSSRVYRQEKDKSWQPALNQLSLALSNSIQTNVKTQPQPLAPELANDTASKHEQWIHDGWEVVSNDIPESIAKARAVLMENPKNARALHLLGWAAVQDLKFDLGLSVLSQATQLEPNNGNIWRDFIRAHVLLEQPTEALMIGERCLANPHLWAKGVVYYALGSAYSLLEDDLHALACFERCMELIPNHLDAATTAALTRFRLGDHYARLGFKLNTARGEARGPNNFPYWVCPVLKGNVAGLKVLIVRSMGFGDELSYLRYLPYLVNAGVHVTYWSGYKLAPLLARLPYSMTVIPDTEPIPDPTDYDIAFIKNELPIAVEHLGAPEIADSLPLVLDQDKLEQWRTWLKAQGDGPYIGVTWRAGVGGNVKDAFSYTRLSKKVELADFAKALAGINVTFISLTRNITKDELNAFEQYLGCPIIDVAGITDDLDDLLCIQYLLDENIGVSNTNMHLRACLGLGSKVLVSLASRDWRWGTQGHTTTWFKDCKVYRESKVDDWKTSLNELRQDLVEKYGLANEPKVLVATLDEQPLKRNKKIIWVTAGQVKKTGQEFYSPLSSAQERVVSIAKMLTHHGWQSEFLNESVSELMGGWHDKLPVKGDVVVFSKVFTDHAITLMKDAKLRGARVVFDVFNDFAELTQRGIHQQKLLESSDIVISCQKMQSKWERNGQPIAFYFENINDELPKEKQTEILNKWLDVLEKNQTPTGKTIKEAQLQKTIFNSNTSSSTSNRLIWFTAGDIKNIEGKNSSNLASARYRVISPINALTTMGWQSEIVNESAAQAKSGWGESSPRAGDTVIISKVFTHHGVIMAKDAKSRGAKVIVDMCDNFLTHPKYGEIQHELLACADAVVTATKSLKDAFIQVGKKVDAVISDPVEFQRGDIKFSPNTVLNLLWFGHPVNIDTLAECLPSIALLSKSIPLKLQVVTNLPNGQQDLDTIVPMGLNANYISWSVSATEKAIADCDLVIIPTVHNDFKNAKSPNRLLEPLWAGRMVVAGPIPAYQPFGDSAWIGKDIVEGIKWCLDNPKEVVKRIAQGQADIEKYFTEQAIGNQWNSLLKTNHKTSSNESKKLQPIAHGDAVKRISVAILSTQPPTHPSIGIRIIESLSLNQEVIEPLLATTISNNSLKINYPALDKAEIVIVHRDFPDIETIQIIKKYKSQGKKIIYETDDAFHLLSLEHPKARHIRNAHFINQCVDVSDKVVVSTYPLKHFFRDTDKVICIPNKLSTNLWTNSLYEAAKKIRSGYDQSQIRIGLIAGNDHANDISLIKEAVCNINEMYLNVHWVGYGDATQKLFEMIPESRKTINKSKWSYQQHPNRLAELGLDILLVPLEDTEFNSCRSELKFLEASFLEVAVIASDTPSYNKSIVDNENGLLVNNHTKAWQSAIENLVSNKELRVKLAINARHKVLTEAMLNKDNNMLSDVIVELAKTKTNSKNSRNFKKTDIALLTNQGEGFPSICIRVLEPFSLIKKYKLVNAYNQNLGYHQGIDFEALLMTDVILVQREFPSPATMPLLKKLKALGKKFVYDTDDAFHLIPEHHTKSQHRDKAKDIFEFARIADLIVVSTKVLANEFKPYGKVQVFPNLLSPLLWNQEVINIRKVKQTEHDKPLRIGVVGGENHRDDFEIIKKAISSIAKINQNIKWVAYGSEAISLFESIPECSGFDSNKTNYYYPMHPTRLAELDLNIALVPLVDDSFNSCISNLKFLEFGFLGIATVFSNVVSYNATVVDGETGVLVKNTTQAWIDAIQKLIHDQSLREKIGANAQKEVQTNWMLNGQLSGWQQILDKLA